MNKSIVKTLVCMLAHGISQHVYRWFPLPSSRLVEDFSEYWRFVPKSTCEGGGLGNKNSALESLFHAAIEYGLWPEGALEWIRPDRSLIFDKIRRNVSETRRGSGQFVAFYSKDYPELLKQCEDPPQMLTVIGNKEHLRKSTISIVGSRRATYLSQKTSFDLGKSLSKAGFVLVSGGALGCDIGAHLGALASQLTPCPAIIIFAGGLKDQHPKTNGEVFKKVTDMGGALVSERFWWESPKPFHFPVRNRIISGISPITCLVQAGERSGALITCRLALDQGREVFAFRHPQNRSHIECLGGGLIIDSVEQLLSRFEQLAPPPQ
jgi:DNA protecting protein DprA